MGKLLFDIMIDKSNNKNDTTTVRQAARAVVIKENQILVMRSTNAEVKLPGGGLKRNESFSTALKREVQEESGFQIKSSKIIGRVIEKSIDKIAENSNFMMESKYYLCELSTKRTEQKLDEYEKTQNFSIDWITINEAIAINEAALLIDADNLIAKRELMVFHELLEFLPKMMDKTSKSVKKDFINATLNGMTYGLFATLIIGTIIGQVAPFFVGTALGDAIISIANVLKGLMGIGIGIGIALSVKQSGLKLISIAITGAIATSFKITFFDPINNTFHLPNIVVGVNNDPLIVYFIVIIAVLFVTKVLVKPTNFDIILIPLSVALVAIFSTFILSAPLNFIISIISSFIKTATDFAPLLMSIVLSVAMGVLLTMPISSVAIATIISLGGVAGSLGAGAAVIGCSTQMIGFAIQSIKDNKIGTVISVGLGTSMLQFKNILKNPFIWLPTIVASAILGPIGTIIYGLKCSTVGAGMGTSGLVGILQTLEVMSYSGNAWLGVLITCVVGPAVLVFLFDLILRKIGLIKKGDLEITKNI